MSGNVWAYCFDLYNDPPTSDITDYVCKAPDNPASLGAIVCGGSFSNGHSVGCTTVGNRTKTGLSNGSIDNGFRLARTITQ